MLENVLTYILTGWTGVGVIVVAIFVFLPALTGNIKWWKRAISLAMILITGMAVLANGREVLAYLAGSGYDAYKGTADIINFVRSKDPSAWIFHWIVIYTIVKYVIKIIFYEGYMYMISFILVFLFGGETRPLKLNIILGISFWILAMIIVYPIVGLRNLDPVDLLSSEGYISIIIAALILLKQVVLNVFGMLFRFFSPKKNEGSPSSFVVGSACMIILYSMVIVYFDAYVWGYVDRWVLRL